jgi:hypothetical protein
MQSYRKLKKQGLLNAGRNYGFKPLTWEIIDEQLGYAYIDESLARNASLGV